MSRRAASCSISSREVTRAFYNSAFGEAGGQEEAATRIRRVDGLCAEGFS